MELALDPGIFMANDALPQHSNLFAGIGVAVTAGAAWLIKKIRASGNEEKSITVRDWRNTEYLREAIEMFRGGVDRLERAMADIPAIKRSVNDMSVDVDILKADAKRLQSDLDRIERRIQKIENRDE